MNLLNRLFGKRNSEETISGAATPTTMNQTEEDQILKNIFVNPEPPIAERVDGFENGIKRFLDQNFFKSGYNDGYSTHSSETLKNQLAVIKSEFRYLLSRKIDEIRLEILEMNDHLINIEGVEERLEKQVQKRLDYLRERINDLENEKALSAEDEGLVMAGVYKYREGFIRGLQTYQEEKLIASSTGMFN